MATVPCQTFPALPSGALGQIKCRAPAGTPAQAQPVEIFHRFAAGEMPKGTTLAAVQCDARTAYPDGSTCDAQITAIAPAVGGGATQYAAFSAGTAPTGSVDISTFNHTIEVDIAPDANATGARPVTAMSIDIASQIKASTNVWRQGPLVAERRVTVTDTGIDSLAIRANVAMYSDGSWRGWLVFDNSLTTMVAGNATKDTSPAAFIATLKVDGAVVDTWTWSIGPGQKIVEAIGQQPTVEAIPDPAVATSRGVLFNFSLDTIDADLAATVEGIAPNVPLGNRDVYTSMGSTGARPDIGPHHLYVLTGILLGTAKGRAGAEAVARTNSAIPWHMSKPTGEPWTSADKPSTGTIWPQAWGAGYSVPYIGSGRDGSGWKLDSAHFPELAAVMYVQNGHQHWLDELIETSHWCILANYTAERGKNGDLVVIKQQTRGEAWGLRNIAYASVLTPDADPNKALFAQAVTDNLAAIQAEFAQQTQAWGPYILGSYGGGSSKPPWQNDYFTTGLLYLARNGHATASSLMSAWANWQVGRFYAGPEGFPWWDGFTYNISITPSSNASGQNIADPSLIYQTWPELEAATITLGQSNTTATGTLDATWPHAKGDYSTLAMFTLNGFASLGCDGASAAATFLGANGNTWSQPAFLAQQPYWRLTEATPPAQGVFGAYAPLTYKAPSIAPGSGFDFSKVQAVQNETSTTTTSGSGTTTSSGSGTTTSTGSSSGTTTSGGATSSGGSTTTAPTPPPWVATISKRLADAQTIGATKVTFTFDAATAKVIGTDWSA